DGHRALPMLFDSGGFNLVTPKTAKLLGLRTEGALQARGIGEGVEELAVTRVGEMRLGGATLRDQIFYVLPLTNLAEVEGVDVAGVLGFEVLQRFVVEIDYARRRLTLTQPEKFDPASGTGAGTELPFVFAGHVPAVAGTIDGLAGRFTIDTGSRGAVALHRPFVERHDLVARYRPDIDAVTGWGVGGGVRAKVTCAGLLMLGTVEVPLPITELVTAEKGALADRYLAGNVGGGVLRRFRVTFDYRRERLYLAPGGDATEDVFDRAGLWLVEHGRELVVEDLIPGGPAAAAGVMPGDRLLALDGVAVRKLGAAAVREHLRNDPPGTRVRLRVRGGGRGGDSREVEAVLRDLPPPVPVPAPTLGGAPP
ncbi:MAG TPA: aspartyl protease family protein, partial [Thermoanaerobaculia bacterium]|nr:aspartyl protease family protein [Thermoanaerobaculia bacterium]